MPDAQVFGIRCEHLNMQGEVVSTRLLESCGSVWSYPDLASAERFVASLTADQQHNAMVQKRPMARRYTVVSLPLESLK